MRVEERVEERTRIARELHDTLLQTVQGFMLRLQAVNEMMPAGAAKNELEETLEIGDQAIAEGRKTVQDLRSAFTTSDLVEAVRAVGDELASRDAAAFRVVVEGPVRDLNPIVRDEVYSIAREALRNAFAHARATHINAEITFDEWVVRLRNSGRWQRDRSGRCRTGARRPLRGGRNAGAGAADWCKAGNLERRRNRD